LFGLTREAWMGAIRPGSSRLDDKAVHRRRVDDEAPRTVLPPVRRTGTEYNVYSTGVYTANDPLGPFTYAPYNPVAYKPGGLFKAPDTATHSRTCTATGGTRARRGSQ
jgi:hypothetical protein